MEEQKQREAEAKAEEELRKKQIEDENIRRAQEEKDRVEEVERLGEEFSESVEYFRGRESRLKGELAAYLQQSEWESYINCKATPNAEDPRSLNTYIAVVKEKSHINWETAIDDGEVTESIVKDIQKYMCKSLETNDSISIAHCMQFTTELHSLTHDELDAATLHMLNNRYCIFWFRFYHTHGIAC